MTQSGARARKWIRRLVWAVVVISGLITAAYFAVRTPDTDRTAMEAKYGGPESRFVTLANGARVHVRDTGAEAAAGKPVIVLIHGSNSSLHTWEPMVARLRNRFRLITMDMPGHGLTGAIPSGRYDTESMMETVDGVTRSLGVGRFILGGNSMGGGISWRYAVAHPDQVSALLLLDAGGMPPRAGDASPPSNIGFRIMRSSLGRWLGERITPRSLIRRSLEQSVADPSIVDEAMVDRYWELLRYPGNRAASVARFSQRFNDPAIAEQARRIAVPTLILFGREDRIISPSAAQSFAERIAGSDVVLLDNIGHLPMEEAPDATVAAVLSFLERNGLAGPAASVQQ